jgi:hypothetical protein
VPLADLQAAWGSMLVGGDNPPTWAGPPSGGAEAAGLLLAVLQMCNPGCDEHPGRGISADPWNGHF